MVGCSPGQAPQGGKGKKRGKIGKTVASEASRAVDASSDYRSARFAQRLFFAHDNFFLPFSHMRSLVQGYVSLRSSTTFEAVARVARISVKPARKRLLRGLRGKENCICRTLINGA